MFDDFLQGMSGRGERFAKVQQNGQYDQVDPDDAADYVGQFMKSAPPEMQQQVLRQYVSQLDPRQRQALAQAMIQHNHTPVQNVRDDDDDDLAGALARSGQALAPHGNAGLGSLFDMFGGAMGGGQQQPQGGGLGGMLGGGQQQSGGLGGMLGGMLGGGQQQQQGGGLGGGLGGMLGGQQQQGGGLGQMLQNPMARAGLVSLAAVIGSQLAGRGRR